MEAGEGARGAGEDEHVVVAGGALGDGAVEGYFLRERVSFLVVLPEEMIIVS